MAFAPTIEGREEELSPILRAFRTRVAEAPPLTAQELLNTLLARDVLRANLLAKMEEFPILIARRAPCRRFATANANGPCKDAKSNT